MNVYQKLALARQKLKASGLKQSGKNKGIGYTYFDLQDILPQTTNIEHELGLLSVVSFTETEGTLTIFDAEQPADAIVFKSPLKEAKVGSCQPVQNLGAMETYVRRYLYLLAYEIVETEVLDKQSDSTNKSGDNTSAEHKSESFTGKAKTKYVVITEMLKGSEFDLDDVSEYIQQTFGDEIKINDLTDQQFENVVMTLKKNIKKGV